MGRTMYRSLASALAAAVLISTVAALEQPCAAEAGCKGACGDKYAHAAADFPYTVDVTKEDRAFTTNFYFKVCAAECQKGSAYCQPLKSFFLRLDSAIVQTPRFIRSIDDSTPVTECGERGQGYRFSGKQLRALHRAAPASGACETFSVEAFNPAGGSAPLQLTDLCAQGVSVVDATGAEVFAQGASSCMFLLELEDGKSGVAEAVQAAASSLPRASASSLPRASATSQASVMESVTSQRRRLLAYSSPKVAPVYRSPKTAPAYASPKPYYYTPSPTYTPPSPKVAPVYSSPKTAPVYASPKPYYYTPSPTYVPPSPKVAPVYASPKTAPVYASPKPYYTPYAAPTYVRAARAEVSRFARPGGRSLLSIPNVFNQRQNA